MDKSHCVGCHDNFYNSETSSCWMLKSAKLAMRKRVHVDQIPPWKNKPAKFPICYHEDRYVYVDPTREC